MIHYLRYCYAMFFALFGFLLATPLSAQAQTREAYVSQTEDETTLTFYYDALRATRTGTTWGIEEDITLSSPHSDVPKLLARARTVTQRRSLIVIVTDATQPEPTRVSDDLIKSLSVRHQVMQICVADIDPTSLDTGTDVVDVNEGPLPDFLLRDDQLSGEAANVMAMRRAAVTQMLDKRGVIHVDVSSSEEVPRALMRALERGAHVR